MDFLTTFNSLTDELLYTPFKLDEEPESNHPSPQPGDCEWFFCTGKRDPSPTSVRHVDESNKISTPRKTRKLWEKVLKKLRLLGKGSSEAKRNGRKPLLVKSLHAEEVMSDKKLNTFRDSGIQGEITYLTSEERKAYQVDFKDGKVEKNGTIFSTKNHFTHWSCEDTAIFVIGPDKKLYIAHQELGKFHHSSFFAGGAIIGAGEITIDEGGVITKLSNRSGHYRPDVEHFATILEILYENGVNLVTIKMEIIE